MRVRTLRIWKKGKPVWIFLLFWAVCSAVMLFLFGYSLFDLRGGLPKEEILMSQKIEIPAEEVQSVSVKAEGVHLEIGSSSDIRGFKVQMYGPGYINQKANWKLDKQGCLHISLAEYPITANAYGDRYPDNVTMRVLLPKKSYNCISVFGDRLHVDLVQCRGKKLISEVAYGSLVMRKADLQRAELSSNTADISVERSRIHYLTVKNQKGNTRVFDTKTEFCNCYNDRGDLEVITGNLKGIRELSSNKGDIHIGTKKWDQHLLVQLHTNSGKVTASSKKKPWKKTIPEAIRKNELILMEGRGENMLLVTSESGDIKLDSVKLAQ